MRRSAVLSVAVGVSAVMVASLLSGAASAGPERPEAVGSFSEPFVEPTIGADRTEEECVEHDGHEECKPAAGTMSVLADGRILYFNALEGTENIQQSTGGEFGHVSVNDQTRILDLSGPRWSEPSPVDGGANPDGYEEEELLPGSASQETHNDGALFCADVVTLSDGRVLAIGGTAYYDEGIAELEGLKNARIFDPEGDRWSQTGSMRWGRWYPSGVTLANGNVFVASGVTKLIKPLYREHPQDSGRNVVQTETFDVADGKWLYNGASADRSLPLYPRLHLLPNGSIYYNASGQVFNPMGQSYDEFGWNIAAAYDPEQKTWTDLGIPGIGTS
ncbi:MAG: galactose oxidase, partial [Actinomycetota bacterium]